MSEPKMTDDEAARVLTAERERRERDRLRAARARQKVRDDAEAAFVAWYAAGHSERCQPGVALYDSRCVDERSGEGVRECKCEPCRVFTATLHVPQCVPQSGFHHRFCRLEQGVATDFDTPHP